MMNNRNHFCIIQYKIIFLGGIENECKLDKRSESGSDKRKSGTQKPACRFGLGRSETRRRRVLSSL